MDKRKKSTAAGALVDPVSRRPRQPPNVRIVQNFHLIWLDGSIDETNSEDCRNSITKVRQVMNTVNTFTDPDECIDYINDIKSENTFLIVSEIFSETVIPIVQNIAEVISIYIICNNNDRPEQWAKQWFKVKGFFTDITTICEALKKAAHDCDKNSISISFVKTSDGSSNKNLDELDQSFMYTLILEEILLTIDFEPVHFNEFLTYCREQFTGNTSELKNVDHFENEYRSHQPIWWYTYQCFLYSMLNRALRMMEVELIIKMGFFVRDLHEHLVQLHSEQYAENSTSFIVYRGQGMSQTEFDELVNTKGGLISFNNFLSTSFVREVSFTFAESNSHSPDMIGVLFRITIDPSIASTPFAKVNNVSYFKSEEELLFSMHSVFRIGQMKSIDGNNRLWHVDLLLTDDNDPDFCELTECMRVETFPHLKGWRRLCELLIKLDQLDKAQQVCEILLDQSPNEREEADIYNMLGMVKIKQGEYAEAIIFSEKSIKIEQQILSPTDPDLASSYSSIGFVYYKMGDYSKALSYHEKDLEICQKSLNPNHPDLAATYNNIGLVYNTMGDYSNALLSHEKALKIRRKSLPPNHPSLATSYNNIGSVYSKMGDYSKALSYHEKDLEICQKTLPPNHPDLATSYSNTGSAYSKMGDYSKALTYYEKDLEICQKTLPPNHPDLAISYNNIGSVYSNIGDYSKALSSHENALEIYRKSLPPNHPDLATSYNNIGLMYSNMGDYPKALLSHEKGLEIYQKSLPPNHPNLATSYNNIGGVYVHMGDYSSALSFYECTVDIGQRSLSADHPRLQLYKENFEFVKKKL
jgi:tetratricopeptide (TPR) repeat protein